MKPVLLHLPPLPTLLRGLILFGASLGVLLALTLPQEVTNLLLIAGLLVLGSCIVGFFLWIGEFQTTTPEDVHRLMNREEK